MPSFDIVSKVDMQELDNAINNTIKEISNRYDFRNSKTTVELNKKDKIIHIVTSDEMKMGAIKDMICANCVKRKVSPKSLDFKEVEPTSQLLLKRDVKIKEGVEKEMAQKIVRMIKELDMKVQASIQDEQVRVTGKKIDDLQTVIQSLGAMNLEIALQYVNMKS